MSPTPTGTIAQRIGEIVQLIETIAVQTNLPAAAGEISRQSETLRHDVDTFVATVRAA